MNIIGNREIIRNYCENDDFEKVGKSIPSQSTRQNYILTKCLNCGAILPADLKTLRRCPPKKCSFCSGIGYKGNLQNNRNAYIELDDCFEIIINYKDTTVSTYIDKTDKQMAEKYIWRITKKKNKFYVVTGQSKNKTLLYLHNLLMGRTNHDEGMEIDHIDCNSLNNRRNNLKKVTRLENIHNTSVRIDNTIGIRGISKYKNRYIVDFSFNNKRFYFKQWKTLEEAVYCRKIAEDIYGLNILNRNPLAKQYLTLTAEEQNIIHDYVTNKILGN